MTNDGGIDRDDLLLILDYFQTFLFPEVFLLVSKIIPLSQRVLSTWQIV